MDFGVSTASFYPQLSEDSVKMIGQNGIPFCEFFTNTYSEISQDYIKRFRQIADESNTSVISLHPFTCPFEPFLLFTGYERRFHDGLALYQQYFEAMNLLGAKIFVFHGDRAESPFPDKRYYERFAVLRDLGKQFGITVAQENVARCKSRSLEFLVGMKKYLNNDVSFVFDNKQAIRSVVDYHDFIDALGENIVHVHISDNGKSGDCLPIGDGEVDFNELFSLLKKQGFNGKALVELYRSELHTPKKTIESYKKLVLLHI